MTYPTYEEALRAADGDPKRVSYMEASYGEIDVEAGYVVELATKKPWTIENLTDH